jgi:hypothetical protein
LYLDAKNRAKPSLHRDSFLAKVNDAQFQFEKNKKGEITYLYLIQNENKTKAEKIK